MTLKEAQSYSLYKLMKLETAAKKGDESALYTLTTINLRLKREANNRLENLERHGYTQYAYDLATTYTKTAYQGSNRFKGIELTSPLDMRRQIMQMQTFLSKRTSFVAGQQQVEKRRLDTFKTMIYRYNLTHDKPIHMSDRKLKNFLKFLGDRTVRDLVDSNSAVSGEQVDRLMGAFQHTKLDELMSIISKYSDTQAGLVSSRDEDFLGYDKLIQYLENPTDFKAKNPNYFYRR